MKIILYNLLLKYVPSFHLEVIGAGGAVWGFSEMIGLRDNENVLLWRVISVGVTILFLFRWIIVKTSE